MASFRVELITILFFLHVLLLLSVPVLSDDEEGQLLQGLNSYRQTRSAAALQKSDKADCLADEIADEIENRPCPATSYVASKPGAPPQVDNYADLLKKCKIDPNTTQEALILPVCVSKRVATLVLSNYTNSPNSMYLNSSKYTGAGIGTDNDWTVLVLTTNTVGGSLANAACFTSVFNLKYNALGIIVGLLILVVL